MWSTTLATSSWKAMVAARILVQASVSYTLANFVENFTLTGLSAISGTGNSLNNNIIGTVPATHFPGFLVTTHLDGGLGSDTLIGGLGDDTFVVDNAGDVVTESANEGTDTVRAAVSYTLRRQFRKPGADGACRDQRDRQLSRQPHQR